MRPTRSTLFFILIATVVALSLRFFVMEIFRISSGSMQPALAAGDLVVVNKLRYNAHLPFTTHALLRFRAPQRGEVVVFSVPDKGLESFVKRAVAVEADVLEMKDGDLYINNELQAWGQKVEAEALKNYGPISVPAGHFFALGDNRNDSIDSRVWGPVPYTCLKGKVSLVWLSVAPGGGLRGERFWLSVP